MATQESALPEPRIAPVPPNELSDEQREVLGGAILNDKGVLRRRTPDDPYLPWVGILLRHPRLYASFTPMGDFIFRSGRLAAREREMIILRIGWLCKSPHQWAHHVRIAHQLGMSAQDLERITKGPSAPGWAEREHALLSAVDELHSSSTLSDATWRDLQPHFDEQQLIELVLAIGRFHQVAFALNALRTRCLIRS